MKADKTVTFQLNCVICRRPVPKERRGDPTCSPTCSTELQGRVQKERQIAQDIRDLEASAETLEEGDLESVVVPVEPETDAEIPIWSESALVLGQLGEAMATCTDPAVARLLVEPMELLVQKLRGMMGGR